MRKVGLLFVAVLFVIGGLNVIDAAKPPKQEKLLRHVVLFKFKEGTSEKDVKRITDAFAALPGRIDAIHSFEWGTDVSVENKAAGYTHGFLVTFRDAEGRKEYLPHPAHEEFKKIVGPHLAGVLVFDYFTQ